ncbi:MAG: hypothetical protein N2606_01370 [Candidatus Omnitrophica bacterium]|nr:hypothetical protein [Candidatus Omnitrophota bacterium]
MSSRKNFYDLVEEIYEEDPRYRPDSYEFVLAALEYTQHKFKIAGHVSAKILLEGIRELALKEYGPMAKTVLKHWGISSSLDFGNIVFNMVKKKILSKNEEDTLEDFKEAFNFEQAFQYRIKEVTI